MRTSELLRRLARRSRVQVTLGPVVTLQSESHRGVHGVSVFEDGKRVAWGADATSAIATYQVARAS